MVYSTRCSRSGADETGCCPRSQRLHSGLSCAGCTYWQLFHKAGRHIATHCRFGGVDVCYAPPQAACQLAAKDICQSQSGTHHTSKLLTDMYVDFFTPRRGTASNNPPKTPNTCTCIRAHLHSLLCHSRKQQRSTVFGGGGDVMSTFQPKGTTHSATWPQNDSLRHTCQWGCGAACKPMP